MDDDPRRRFEALWARHHPRVLAYARRRAAADVAEEVAAEAFAVAWRRLGDVPQDAGPWLLGVARNLLANRARGERRAGALARRLGRERPAPAPDPADLVGDDRPLRAAFAALSARDREVLALVAWEGLAPREVAAVLGIPAPMASARIHRARARLRRGLAAAGPEAVPATREETS
jgi:RNA polymerase sigma-70 factor (ECF subfamily)